MKVFENLTLLPYCWLPKQYKKDGKQYETIRNNRETIRNNGRYCFLIKIETLPVQKINSDQQVQKTINAKVHLAKRTQTMTVIVSQIVSRVFNQKI